LLDVGSTTCAPTRSTHGLSMSCAKLFPAIAQANALKPICFHHVFITCILLLKIEAALAGMERNVKSLDRTRVERDQFPASYGITGLPGERYRY
jgi:hypothetical protein